MTVTVTFPDSSQSGNTVSFSSEGGGGNFSPATAAVSGTSASTSFTSGSAGTFNINAVLGIYAGGATVVFTPAPPTTYSISGTVSLSGVGQSGVMVALTGSSASTITGSDGSYSFTGLPSGSYTVTPSSYGYTFSPFFTFVTVNGGNVTGQDFVETMWIPQESVLHSFPGGSVGGAPYGGLVQASDGNFYGTTQAYGGVTFGTVFKITPAGAKTLVYAFTGGPDAEAPMGRLIQASDGNLYGTTVFGGSNGAGTAFQITPGGAERVLWNFGAGSDGAHPYAGLIQASDGNFYGTTQGGGTGGGGTVFKITPAGAETVLWNFGAGSDGAVSYADLIQASDGNLYGTTVGGGANGAGAAFKITPGGAETVLWNFGAGSDGATPLAGLIEASDGNLYGTTKFGGTSNLGTVFKITINPITHVAAETVLHSFTGGSDGAQPYAVLIRASDGNLYGTTYAGGTNGAGTAFKITPAGAETVLWNFGAGSDGALPYAGLIQASDGNFYGATGFGGVSNWGTVFKLIP